MVCCSGFSVQEHVCNRNLKLEVLVNGAIVFGGKGQGDQARSHRELLNLRA